MKQRKEPTSLFRVEPLTLLFSLTLDAESCCGHRNKSRLGNRAATAAANSISAGFNLPEGFVYGKQTLTIMLSKAQEKFPVTVIRALIYKITVRTDLRHMVFFVDFVKE